MSAVAERDEQTVTGVELCAPRVMRGSRAIKLSRINTREDRECPVCGAIKQVGQARCRDCRGLHITDGRVNAHETFGQDEQARSFVEENVGGATLHEVGLALGVTRERVRQIEEVALRKLRAALRLQGVTLEDVVEVLMRPRPGEDVPSGVFTPEHERMRLATLASAAEREAALAEPSEWLAGLYMLLDEAQAVADAVIAASEAP